MAIAPTIREQLDELLTDYTGGEGVREIGAEIIVYDPNADYPDPSIGLAVKEHGAEIDALGVTVSAQGNAITVNAGAITQVSEDLTDLGDTVETLALTASVEYPTIAAGLSATTEGGYFVVRESGDNYATRYQKVGGVEVYDNALAGKAVTDQIQATVTIGEDGDAGVDPDGIASWAADKDGLSVSGGRLDLGDMTLTEGDPNRLVLLDPDGIVLFDSGDVGGDSEAVASEAVYAARDAANVAYATAGANDLMPMVQGIVRGKVNIILTYGQSLDRSSRGYPPLTTTQPSYSDANVFSLGQSCRPTDSDSTTYGPLTSGAIYPLRAVSHNDAGTILDSAALNALGPDTSVPGEGSAISATYWLRQQWLASIGLEEDATTPFILLSCGVGGQSLASLSKGASPEYYNRIISGLTQIRDHATFAGKEFSVALIKYTQGEQDYSDGTGGDHPDVASYMAGVQQLRDDINADIETIFANGQKPPAFFLSQTSGQFTTDTTNLHVGTAQLRLVSEVDGFFPVSPNYPVVDVTSAHPDNNGYRWLGQYEGRAWSQVLVHGRRPNIVYPRRATWEAATGEVIIDLCSTGGPVVAGQPWDGFTQTDLDNFGISAKAGATVVALDNVRLVGAMTIAATPAIPLSAAPLVQFGSKANSNGYVGLRCPSRQVAPEVYTFIPDAGQDPAADVPALIGKPYNLDDWCWAASIQAEEI